jgi:hypothetical protein
MFHVSSLSNHPEFLKHLEIVLAFFLDGHIILAVVRRCEGKVWKIASLKMSYPQKSSLYQHFSLWAQVSWVTI